jgi:hypothetical protein
MNLNSILGIVARDNRSGPCEDDVERTAPYLGICPEESDHEDGSPLDFGNDAQRSASSYFDSNERRWAQDARNLRIAAKRAAALCDDF